jgi:hypothetical protein
LTLIANGYLRLDHEEWIRVVEKRSAALDGVSLVRGRPITPSAD